MTVRQLYGFLILLGLLQACRSENQSQFGRSVTSIDLDRVQAKRFHEHLTDLTFIPLEITAESALRYVLKVKLIEGLYYILDVHSDAILRFDASTGDFVDKLRNPGRGPGEFELVNDFYYNPWTRSLEILAGPRSFISYDFKRVI